MKTKIIQFIPAILALLAIGFSYFSLWCTEFGQLCYRTWLDAIFLSIVNPLYFFSLYFLPIVIILSFVPREIFKSWLKLAVWAIPISILYIWATPVWDTSLLPFSRDDAARLAGGIFSAVSLALIIISEFFARRKPR